MVIDSGNNIPSGGSGNSRIDARNSKPVIHNTESAPSSSQSKSGDQSDVSLSNRAQTLNKLESQIRESSDVDSAKVAQIKQALADGSYNLDADKIASNMIAKDDWF